GVTLPAALATRNQSVGKLGALARHATRYCPDQHDPARAGTGEEALVDSRMRGKAKTREGVVVSDKMDKTVVVMVERLVQHTKYKKYRKRRSKVKAHDQANSCGIGDRVIIAETRP